MIIQILLSPPLDYDVGFRFLDKTSYNINDINFGQQQVGCHNIL